MQKIHLAWILVSAMFMASCGGGGDGGSDDTPPASKVAIHATEAQHAALAGQAVSISLADAVQASDGSALRLVALQGLADQPGCGSSSFAGLEIQLSEESQAGSCVYQYTVQARDGTRESAVARVVLKGEADMESYQLAPITVSVTKGESIEITPALPEGYELDELLVVLGSGLAHVADGKIHYKGGVIGVAQVLYQAVQQPEVGCEPDETNACATKVKLGSVNIAISGESMLTSLGARNFLGNEYAHDKLGNDKPLIYPGETVTIDVIDGNPGLWGRGAHLHDVNVNSNQGKVSVVPVDTLEHTELSFSAAAPGEYDIAYTVTDHKYGFSSAVIRVNVGNYYDTLSLTLGERGLTFLPPLTVKQVEESGFLYQDCVKDGGAYESKDGNDYCVARFNYAQAERLCHARGGRLPSIDEFTTLFINRATVDYDSWPQRSGYLTAPQTPFSGTEGVSQYDWSTGGVSKLSSAELENGHYYVTCLKEAGRTAEDLIYEINWLSEQPVNGTFYFDIKYRWRDWESSRPSEAYTGSVASVVVNGDLAAYVTSSDSPANGRFMLKAGNKAGEGSIRLTLTDTTSELYGFEIVQYLDIYHELSLINGVKTYNYSSVPLRKQYFKPSDKIYMTGGTLNHDNMENEHSGNPTFIETIGVSQAERLGGGESFWSDYKKEYVPLDNIRAIVVSSCELQWWWSITNNDPSTVINRVEFLKKNGDYYVSGQFNDCESRLSVSKSIVAGSGRTLKIMSFNAYSNHTNTAINGIDIYAREE